MKALQTAVRICKWDSQGGLRLVKDQPIPEPGHGEVLVRVYLRPVNPTDLLFINGRYPGKPILPAVPGSEGVGKVEHNGPGATKYKIGQRVCAAPWPTFQGGGTWQQYVAVPEQNLVAVPDGLSDQAAAQFFINPVTVVGLLDAAGVPPGEFLLQNAAAATLGRMMIGYAKHRGVQTINVVRRKSRVAELTALGAEHVIDSSVESVVDRVKAITGGKGAYAAIDPVGGDAALDIIKSIQDKGRYIAYGSLGGGFVKVATPDLQWSEKALAGFVLYKWLPALPEDKREDTLTYVMDLLAKGILKPATVAGDVFPLEQYEQALQEHGTPARDGKVFLEG